MKRITRRLLLLGSTVAGMIGLGIGEASLPAASGSASGGVAAAHLATAARPAAAPANAGASSSMNPKNCPNMSGSAEGRSTSSAT
ncbi:MAG TPA: hypothetical protein VNH38_04305 [Candidatus Dormibacteraeota bacterium]|nr:hypothetical protein [Candidatus Dormibacteraeota bacterium]